MNPTPADYNLQHSEWRPHQHDSVSWCVNANGYNAVEAPTGCHAKGQGILTWRGKIVNVEDIAVGEKLMGPDNVCRRVRELIRGHGRMYRIIPVKGDPFVVNEDHVLTLIRTNTAKRGENTRPDCLDGEIVDVSIKEWLGWARSRKHIYKLFRRSVYFPVPTFCPVDPYFLGIILGDGSLSSTVGITKSDKPIVEEIEKWADVYGLHVKPTTNPERATTYFLYADRGKPNKLIADLRELGLMKCNSSNKFVPEAYKLGSRFTRLQILAGLLDTDGYLGRKCYDFISKSKQLTDDVVFLCRSLGLAAYSRETYKEDQFGHGGIYYRASISGEVSNIPCRIRRKKCTEKRRQVKSVLRTGFKVEEAGEDDYYGFVLDGDGRYLMDDFTVTHNSGKTSFARATSSRRSVIALCRTKNLQAENYGDEYRAAVLFGRGNYECIHKDAEVGATCDECLHSAKMTECEFYSRCRYIQARDWARGSEFAALNYAYYLTAYWPRSPEDAPDVLFCDEAHQLSDITLDFAGCTLTSKHRTDWELPTFPEIIPNGRMLIKMSDPVDDALGWLNECYYVLRAKYKQLKQKGDGKGMAKCENLGRKVSATVGALERAPEDWYIKSGANARKFRGGYQPGFVARPLTARHHFPSYFNNDTVIMMSATIGDPGAFMGELGVEDYRFRAVPNQWAADARAVHILDAPKMGYKAKPEDYSKQADVIADAILALPTEWSGIVHVTRKSEADLLAKRLGIRGLADRVWVTPGWDGEYVPTDEQVDAWNRRRAAVPNSICVSWAMWEGYNGLDERICIAAKVPFPSLGDEYEKQRLEYSHSFYAQRTAYQLEQGLGRTRRGRACDYGDENGFVAIADGNWTRVQKYLSKSLREAIVE